MSDQRDHLTLSQLARQVPGRPHASTIWRWCRKGVKARNGERVYLQHVRFGGRVFSTLEALHKFGTELAERDHEHFAAEPPTFTRPPRRPTSAQRERQIRLAEERCKAAGI